MPRAVLWRKVTETLISELAKRRFKPGERFYSLRELGERYHVSEITGRRVMSELEDRLLIERIQGKGSFVRRTAIGRDLKLLIDPALTLGSFSHAHVVREIIHGMDEAALRAHCRLHLVSPFYLEHHAQPDDLFATIWHSKHAPALRAIIERNLRGVCAHAPRMLKGVSTVRPDFREGMRLATAHLIAKGHRRIALITGEVHSVWFQPRFDGYYQALKEGDLPLDLRLVKETDDEAGGDAPAALDQLLALPDPPSAVACGNDARALQLLRHCRAKRIRVPRALAIVGFDNLFEGSLVAPALTTIDQFWRRQGQEAIGLLLRHAERRQRTCEDVLIAPALIERETT